MPRKERPAPERKQRRTRWILAGILALACTVVYDYQRFENTSGDTISARYWPVSILKHHTLTLNPFKKDLEGVAYASLYLGDTWLPRADAGMLPATLPFYALMDLLNVGGEDWTHDRISQVSRWNAIVLATASVLILFFFLARLVPVPIAFISATLFAFGTWQWSLGAQGLSSQTVAVFILVLTLPVMWNCCTKNRNQDLVFLALLNVWLWSTRPSDIPLVAPAILFLLAKKRLQPYLLVAGLSAALVCLGQDVVYGTPGGWRFLLRNSSLAFSPNDQTWDWNFLPGFFGLLFSPNRGAIVFFPLLLLVPYLWFKLGPWTEFQGLIRDAFRLRLLAGWRNDQQKLKIRVSFSLILICGSVLYFLSIAVVTFWHSTWSYGPRYLYDLLPWVWPFLTLAFWKLLTAKKKSERLLPSWLLPVMILFALQGVVVHWLGHRNFDIYVWNFKRHTDSARAWDYKDFMMIDVWNAGQNTPRWPDALQRLKRLGF